MHEYLCTVHVCIESAYSLCCVYVVLPWPLGRLDPPRHHAEEELGAAYGRQGGPAGPRLHRQSSNHRQLWESAEWGVHPTKICEYSTLRAPSLVSSSYVTLTSFGGAVNFEWVLADFSTLALLVSISI